MEVDTGASLSLVSEATYRNLWHFNIPQLQPTEKVLSTYTGESLEVLGSLSVLVKYGKQKSQLELFIIAGSGPSLLGRDWLLAIKIDWSQLHHMTVPSALHKVLQKHATVFKDELGEVKGTTVKIHVDPQARPHFCKPRTVPYAMRGKVEQELDRLERDGIIQPVEFSEWAAPIVPVVKTDGSIRICGDYHAAKLDTYPLPRADDLFALLAGGKTCTALDLAHAYQQIPLNEDSKKLVCINTHKGLYAYNRLPFGVSSTPSIFQRTMESILHGINQVLVYLDDILVTGRSDEEHLQRLGEVLTRLEAAGLRLRQSKCKFMQPSVEYLGHRISSDGLHPTPDMIRAISEAPAPTNMLQLRAFLGMVNYYAKFLPRLSSMLSPLYRLLQKNARWSWGPEEDRAFQTAKSSLTSSSVLTHYDPAQELFLDCDASPYGVGAVLSHRMADRSMKPIAYASRSLHPAEKRYSQLDKESLAIVFGVKKFHHYLFGRTFTICSDHKHLQHLFSASRPIPQLASARIQRWALTLSAYDYSIVYRPGTEMGNADSLSWLPLPEAPASVPLPGETVLLMETLYTSPISPAQVKKSTVRDPVLLHVLEAVRWHNLEGEEFDTHGLPKLLVSDNGTAFTSAEFQEFLSHNGFRRLTSAPYHPSSNGLAERVVQIFKSNMQKGSDEDVQKQLSRSLFCYQSTPHSTTGLSPAEMLMGRRLRTHLDLMRPDVLDLSAHQAGRPENTT